MRSAVGSVTVSVVSLASAVAPSKMMLPLKVALPTNVTAGQSGVIVVTQDGTGSRTLAYNSIYKFAGGTAPTLTTTASAVDVLAYYVESSTRITVTSLLNVS